MFFKKWRLALVVIWMCVIFLMSHLDGATSWILTGELFTVLKTGSVDTESSLDEKLTLYDEEHNWNMMVFLRKAAHFGEYFILAVLIMNALLFNHSWQVSVKMSFLISGLYAVFDEVHQLLIPDRTGRLIDVGIDMAGIIAALLILGMIKNFRKARIDEN